ncbi:MAG TPA: nuclear transport factor 2 family protein [Microthrixaceae bacterium]|nr:nuclear transport factor 2 family protein [Microthrixaceae bacterium]
MESPSPDTADLHNVIGLHDVIEVQQLLARYAVGMTKNDVESVMDVFTSDGTYSAFGDTYVLADFPTLVAAAPKGLFMVGLPVVDLDAGAGTGTGEQPLCFVDQTNHHMRIGWYTDTYLRTERGWRLRTRSMTFLRKSGARDSGRAHDPTRPTPTAASGSADATAG